VNHDRNSTQTHKNVLNASGTKQGGPAVSKLASANENKIEREIKKKRVGDEYDATSETVARARFVLFFFLPNGTKVPSCCVRGWGSVRDPCL